MTPDRQPHENVLESAVRGVEQEEGANPKENQRSWLKEGETLLGSKPDSSPHQLNRKQVPSSTQCCRVTKSCKESSPLKSTCLAPPGVVQCTRLVFFLHTACLTSLPSSNRATITVFSVLLLEGLDLSAEPGGGRLQLMTLPTWLVLFFIRGKEASVFRTSPSHSHPTLSSPPICTPHRPPCENHCCPAEGRICSSFASRVLPTLLVE